MKIERYFLRVLTLAFIVGALFCVGSVDAKPYPKRYSKAFTRSYNRGSSRSGTKSSSKGNAKGKTITWSKTEITSNSFQNTFSKNKSPWLDDYSQPVGFTYGADAVLQTTYLWRGLYAGGMNLQASANVGYGGLYTFMWWNVGTHDWRFETFQPEVDLAVGFSRWGLNAFVVYIHNFNRRFFDFTNHPDGGNALEIDLRYTVSSKLPLSILWATRVAASDGYVYKEGDVSPMIPKNAAVGDTIRAYSTYIELSYKHNFPYDISLRGAVGLSPWKSPLYGNSKFAVQNVELTLRKDWNVSDHCGIMIQGTVSVNPSGLAADNTTYEWHPESPGAQTVNANIGFGVYLK